MTEAVRRVKKAENQRDALIELKNSLKRGEISLTDDDIKYLKSLLLSLPDPKSRKNVAQILGESGRELCEEMIEAYEKEDTEYVKASYLYAMEEMDISSVKDKLEEMRTTLSESEVPDENKKHYDEQMGAFNELLGMAIGKHVFTGWDKSAEVILLTGKGLGQITLDQLDTQAKRLLGIGVYAKLNEVSDIKEIRTYKELLFMIPELRRIPDDPYKAAEAVAGSELKNFLVSMHDNAEPWAYRLNVVSTMDDKKKAMFIRRFAGELQRHSDGFYVNDASDYELEIRLLESREGGFTPMLRLFSIKDERFAYRKEYVAASIRPDLAATLIRLSSDYLRSDIQTIDPFCGVGTMLIERLKFSEVHPAYGIDIYGEAIKKAKENAKLAGEKINFINRDYFDFKHKYRFDELITNMPFAVVPEDRQKIREIYRKFFEYSKKILRKDAFLIIYLRDIDAAREFSVANGYIMEKEMLISDKEDSYLCIYRNI